MRKFLFLLSLLLTFSISAILGYLTAANTPHASRQEIAQAPLQATQSATQTNFLLLQADSLDSDHPQLRSVWVAAFFQSTNQSVLTFTQLYPTTDHTLDRLVAEFAIDQNGKLSTRSMRQAAELDINWKGYLLIDDLGAAQVSTWLTQQGIPVFAQDSTATNSLLESACLYLHDGVQSPGESASFNWASFDPHFDTDLPLDTLLASWNDLFQSKHPTRCVVEKN